MPLDSPEAYERLGQHLSVVDPIIEEFCRETGFTRRTTGIPRYPTRRLDRHGGLSWIIEFRMDEDEHGERYDHFFPDVPYTLSGGAWMDRGGHRYFDMSVMAFNRLPFQQIPVRLSADLRKTWERIRHFTPDYLIALGPRKLGVSQT